MDFSLDQEQLALRDAVRRYCEGTYPAHERGNPEGPELAATRWRGLADMGLLGLPLPAELGGSALGTTEIMLVSQELGRSLGGMGFVPAVVMAGQLLAEAASPDISGAWLPRLAEGHARLSVALSMPEARGDFTRPAVRAERRASGYVLSGHKAFVLEAERPDLVVLAARTGAADGDPDGLTMFAVNTALAGVRLVPYRTLDGRECAQLHLDTVQVDTSALIGNPGEACGLMRLTADRGIAAWAAEAVGAIEALIDLTAEHLKTRRQFGAPLARFQALQHRVADMLMRLEMARSLACAAAVAVAEAPDSERRRFIDSAKGYIGKAGREVGNAAIQLHGGMGMTEECRVGHYVKRLMVLDQLFGNATDHIERLAARIAAG